MAETGNRDCYWRMYADAWAFHQKFINCVDGSDEFWEQVAHESNAIAKKYHENKFIVNLMLNEVFEFERIYKETKADAEIEGRKAAGG